MASSQDIYQAILVGFRSGNMNEIIVPTFNANISTILMPANPNRKGFVIYNNSGNSMYCCFKSPAVASNCVKLCPSFASWECYGPMIWTGIITGIRNAGTGTVAAFEFI